MSILSNHLLNSSKASYEELVLIEEQVNQPTAGHHPPGSSLPLVLSLWLYTIICMYRARAGSINSKVTVVYI